MLRKFQEQKLKEAPAFRWHNFLDRRDDPDDVDEHYHRGPEGPREDRIVWEFNVSQANISRNVLTRMAEKEYNRYFKPRDLEQQGLHVSQANFDLPEWGGANLEERLQYLGVREETDFVRGRFTLFKDLVNR